MFTFFERFLTPTAAPENPEPPGGLIAFLWHFARQAKWLFAALFVIELCVALSDSAVATRLAAWRKKHTDAVAERPEGSA